MNDIAGPAAGLDMLLLVDDPNTANAGCFPDNQQILTFEAVLEGALECSDPHQTSKAGEPALPESEPGRPRGKTRDRDPDPVWTLPLPWDNSGNPPVTFESARDASDVCFAAAEFVEQSPSGDARPIQQSVQVPSDPAMSSQPPSAVDPSDAMASDIASRANLPSTPHHGDDAPLDTRFDDRSRPEIEFASDLSETQSSAEPAARSDSVSPLRPDIRQLGDRIVESIRPRVVARVQRPLAETRTPGHAGRSAESADRSDRVSPALYDAVSFPEASAPESIIAEIETPHVAMPTLVDELTADAGRFDSNHDEITVELDIPDWGRLEIEVTRDGDETEVSLLADPAVNQLIRDHLPELTEALSASGIELAGLDVRQHDHARAGHEVFVPVETNSVGSGDDSQLANIASRTGLSRYRLMSITA